MRLNSFDFCKFLTMMQPAQVPCVEPVQDGVEAMPLLMCKNNFIVEPSLFLEYQTNEGNPSFDLFVQRKPFI